VDGLDQLIQELQDLAPALREHVLKGACATACSVLRKEAIRRAPQYTGDVAQGHPPPGTLKKAIYQTRMVNKCDATHEVWAVNVKRGSRTISKGKNAGQKTNDRDAFYALWVEFGHYASAPHAMTKTAKAAGRALGVAKFIPAHPFMRPAFEAAKGSAMTAMQQYIADHLLFATAANRYLKAA